MKISLNWVREFVEIDLSVDELVQKIGAQLGAVESVENIGDKYKGIIIAKVMKCIKHPNADKLSVCMIDDGGNAKKVERDKDGLVQVVCGAPNVRAGMLVAWLPPGSTVPSSYGKEPFVLEVRELRGVVSNGMLASAHELAIGDDKSGIAEVTLGKPGDDFAESIEIDNNYIIDIENKMFTHRPDCFGIYGVAREIAGITGKQFKTPSKYIADPKAPKIESDLTVNVSNNLHQLVPRFTAQTVDNVHIKPASLWLQARINEVGIRPINNVVDVTNYTMMLTGQPLHAYDYDKLCKVAGTKSAQLEIRLSKKGDMLRLLNGKTIDFEDEETILITSNDVPVGIGGVMGGLDTEVDETTKRIVIESANFDMYSIRRTSMRHGLFTDAVTRFNKGQSPLQCLAALYLATGWVERQAGGKVGKVVDEHHKLNKPKMLRVSVDFINSRLGLNLERREMSKLLTNVEFEVESTDNKDELKITPPFWRTDIEISEDIVEEIGRLYGFDHLPLVLPKRSLIPTKPNELIEFKQTIREILSRAGANEVLTYSFVHGNLIQNVGQNTKLAHKLSNAISPDLQFYRLSLSPSLLDKVHMNIKAGYDKFALFEIGKAHNKEHTMDGLPKETEKTSFVIAQSDNAKKTNTTFYYQAKNYVDYICDTLGLGVSYLPLKTEPKYQTAQMFDFQRSAHIVHKDSGVVVGIVGEYKQSVTMNLKLPKNCAGFELSTVKLLSCINQSSTYKTIPRFPKVTQDITLKLPADVLFNEVNDLLENQLLNQIDSLCKLEALDIYQSDKDKDHKQYSFRYTIANYNKTLKSDEVNALLDNAADVAKKKLHAIRI